MYWVFSWNHTYSCPSACKFPNMLGMLPLKALSCRSLPSYCNTGGESLDQGDFSHCMQEKNSWLLLWIWVVVVNITCLGILQFSMGTMVLTRLTNLKYFPTPLEWDLQGSDSLSGFCKQHKNVQIYSTTLWFQENATLKNINRLSPKV